MELYLFVFEALDENVLLSHTCPQLLQAIHEVEYLFGQRDLLALAPASLLVTQSRLVVLLQGA